MTSTVVIRDARPGEHEEAERLTVAAYGQYADLLDPDHWHQYAADLAAVAARAEESAIVVAEEDGRLVGATAYYTSSDPNRRLWPSDWAAIRALGVLPLHQGRGIGRMLTEECIRRAAGAGAPAIALHTVDFMTAARRLYERMGFRRLRQYEPDPWSTHRVLVYGLALEAGGLPASEAPRQRKPQPAGASHPCR